jgi:hypothetical protein
MSGLAFLAHPHRLASACDPQAHEHLVCASGLSNAHRAFAPPGSRQSGAAPQSTSEVFETAGTRCGAKLDARATRARYR